MEDQRSIESEDDISVEFEEEEEDVEDLEDDDYEDEDEDDDYEEEEDEDDDSEDEDTDDYEAEEVEELIPSETTSLRVSCSIADGLADDSNCGDDGGKKELNRGEIDVCPICFEAWTNGGDHQMSCLPCGHIYGMSCIKRWLLRRQSSGKCPQCKSLCKLKDIRVLYVTRLCFVDEMSHKVEISKRKHEIRNIEEEVAESSHANCAHAGQPEGYDEWSLFERTLWDRARRDHAETMQKLKEREDFERTLWDQARKDHAETMQRLKQREDDQRQIYRCLIFQLEKYRQQYYEYTERIRHHMNHLRGLGYLPVAETIDYSKLPRTGPIKPLPYPGLAPPMYWPQDNSRVQNPFDTSTLAQSLWHSVLYPAQGPPHE